MSLNEAKNRIIENQLILEKDNEKISYKMDSEKVAKLLPLVTLMLLIFGIVKVKIYYALFNFDIFQFSDFSDVFPQIFSDLYFMITQLLLPIIFIAWHSPYITQNISEPKKKGEKKLNRILFYIIAILLFIGLVYFLYRQHALLFCVFDLLKSVGLIFSFWIGNVIYKKLDYSTRQLSPDLKILIAATMVLLFNSANFAFNSFFNVRYLHQYQRIVIPLDDRSLISTDRSYLIGKTKDDLFFYNEQSESVDIMFTSKFKEITIFPSKQ